jgi:hypothetical protein
MRRSSPEGVEGMTDSETETEEAEAGLEAEAATGPLVAFVTSEAVTEEGIGASVDRPESVEEE